MARIISVQGPVVVERSGAPRAQAAGLDDTICPGDRVRVGALGRAAVQLTDEAETPIRLDEGTTLIFPAPEPEKSFLLKLIEGVVHVLSRVPHPLTIDTPMATAYVEGTELVLGVSKSGADLWVFEGRVRVSNPQGQLEVRSGEGALARPGRAPERRVVVKPREAVEWALYYPPLVDPRPESYPPALRAALSAYRANDLPAAFAALERVPAGDRDGRYLLLRAGLLLSVGRVAKAEADLAEAERADPKSGGVSALRSVIALVRDQKEEALRLAQAGAMLDPRSPLPESALSYAYQGRFEIERALEHARRAVDLSPEDALLWARVSELELSRGDLEAALEAAEKAEALNPTLAHTQTVLGFAYLTRIEVDKAKLAFERAIQGDPADPLPRLGMGLAKIRDGDLDEGTRDIETAASLDPNNSLIRSYLGKAYFEEKRGGVAEGEFEQAKLLDPEDPTPWFYDAIQKQTTNRPVEALHDLERAIANNDNRAVYRSRLLLDQDLAARSAALGRIYSDLGFEQLGLVEGWKSVNTDPGDYSGHRLLADSYSALPRHGLARVSELLQSQLRQPANVTPVQPQLGERELLIVEGSGPAVASFNEFNPLFLRNRFAAQAAAVVGSNDTYGDEITQSGVWDRFSYSLGQFHYETDGFRPNNDLTQDIYNAFIQASVSPSLRIQAEARHRDVEHGDIRLNFDLDDFQEEARRSLISNSVRFGAHYSPAPTSDFIASFLYRDQELKDAPFLSRSSYGYVGEAQYLFRSPALKLIAGGGYYDVRHNPFLGDSFRVRHGNA
ncbi:MAG: FecR domain-containing protein [Acidimicrobiia bacterium]